MNGKPAIISPVMRSIGVADIERSISFYRDVLGFQVHDRMGGIEVSYGPASVRFSKHSYEPNKREAAPQSAAMLFFETDDVAAMYAAIRLHGGDPSEMDKVNWIKMRMFAIRDPDGHTLWYGQSYDQPQTSAASSPMMRKALPELPFNDVSGAVTFYRDVLGFRINYQQHDLAVMDRDKITILLIARTEHHKGIGSFEVYIENADALHDELRAKGAHVQGEPVSHPWGLRDFRVLDPEGNRITFAQPFE